MVRWSLVAAVVTFAGASAQAPDDGTPHFWPPGASPPPGADVAPPQELAGFTFGASPQQARRACEGAGHRWSPGHVAVCSGVARDPGFDAKMRLRFCDGALCEATAVLRGEEPLASYVRLVRALRGAFGEEVRARLRAAPGCHEALARAGVGRCDEARARHYWSAGGFELMLRWDHPRGHGLKVAFRAPARLQELSVTSD